MRNVPHRLLDRNTPSPAGVTGAGQASLRPSGSGAMKQQDLDPLLTLVLLYCSTVLSSCPVLWGLGMALCATACWNCVICILILIFIVDYSKIMHESSKRLSILDFKH